MKLSIDNELKIDFIPIVTREYCIDMAEGNDKKNIMTAFNDRNFELENGKWQEGWHEFCEKSTPLYQGAANRENNPDRFAHFLDCEAHTDVWRELFPTWNLTNEK